MGLDRPTDKLASKIGPGPGLFNAGGFQRLELACWSGVFASCGRSAQGAADLLAIGRLSG
jgi:hypothetical protein